jgi:chromosome partitioning protein
LTKCIAFHSYKGGTGKTTLAANFAALLALRGYRVVLLDLDVYAPSLQSYFDANPKKWINDFLFDKAQIEDVLLDFTPILTSVSKRNSIDNNFPTEGKEKSAHLDALKGKLWVGFCNSKKEEIYKLEGGSTTSGKQDSSKIHLLRRFIFLRELLISDYHADYVIIDTSPGIRYWSINALAVADVLLLTLKMGDLDVAGTKKVSEEIYGSFTKFGTKSFLLWNRVAGYCIPYKLQNLPPTTTSGVMASDIQSEMNIQSSFGRDHSLNSASSYLIEEQQVTERNMKSLLSNETGMEVISAIPCYCDIQFSRKEFLTVLERPEHPFTNQFNMLIDAVERI